MVHDLHGVIYFVESVIKLGLSDDQRRSNVENGCANPHEDAILNKSLLEGDNLRRIRVLELSLDQLTILPN